MDNSFGSYRVTQFILQEITLSEYFFVHNITENIFLYIDENYWPYFVGVNYGISHDNRVKFSFVSKQKYVAPSLDWHLPLGRNVEQIDVSKISAESIVVLFSPIEQVQLSQIKMRGAKIYNHNQINWELYEFVFYIRPLAQFAYAHPKITVVSFNRSITIPIMQRNVPHFMSETERLIATNNIDALTPYAGLNLSVQDITDVKFRPKSYLDVNGVRQYYDVTTRCLNIQNGHRVTVGQPKTYSRTIWFAGNCLVYGINVTDDSTFASVVQSHCNSEGLDYRCENFGAFTNNDGESNFNILNSLPVKDGDIVVFSINDFSIKNNAYLKELNISNLFMRPHDYGEVFSDAVHYNNRGSCAIGTKIYAYLKNNDFFRGADNTEKFAKLQTPYQPMRERFGIPFTAEKKIKNRELEESLKIMQTFRAPIGSIVMNCNPFTLGHRYLIEYATSQVVHLYVFVVEEDRSIFPFVDRFELVKQGASDLTNVTVLPSGKFIISTLTFTDYFNKSEIQDKDIDPSFDVDLFAKEIAPTLGITTRFAGEEPFDKVTLQYNQTMARILPQYGIKFVEIPRKEMGGAFISASRVRALLKENNFDEIKKIVPETTFLYLATKYSSTLGGGGGQPGQQHLLSKQYQFQKITI